MPDPYVHRDRVRFRDCDAMGHVNNAVYSTYLEEARIGVLGDLIDFILARVEIDFRSELRMGEDVEVHTRCSRIGTKSFDLEHVISTSADASSPRRRASSSRTTTRWARACRCPRRCASNWAQPTSRIFTSSSRPGNPRPRPPVVRVTSSWNLRGGNRCTHARSPGSRSSSSRRLPSRSRSPRRAPTPAPTASASPSSSVTAAPAATGPSTRSPATSSRSTSAPTTSSPTSSRRRTACSSPGTRTRSAARPTSPRIPSSPPAGRRRRSTGSRSPAGSPRTSRSPS